MQSVEHFGPENFIRLDPKKISSRILSIVARNTQGPGKPHYRELDDVKYTPLLACTH